MAEKITPEEAANVAAAEAAAAVAAAQAEADAARDEREEYLFDLANQIASSQVATQVVAPVAGVAEDVAKEAKKLPLIGDIAEKADEGYEFLRRFGMRKTDEVISSNAASMINSIGVTMLNSLHDHAMPQGIHRFVDSAYGHIWPQMKKTLMDSVMLSAGLEFREAQKAAIERDPPPPKGLLRRIAARYIYAMEPYDLTIWGVIRNPLSLVIQVSDQPHSLTTHSLTTHSHSPLTPAAHHSLTHRTQSHFLARSINSQPDRLIPSQIDCP